MWLRVFVLVSMALTATLTPTLAADQRDGHWWRLMPALGRKFYLVGFLDGTTATYSDAKRAIQSELDRIPGCKAKSCYDRMFAFERQEEGSLDDSEHSYDTIDVEQLEAGIDKIYSDFRNLNIPVFEAEQVAMESLGGESDAEVQWRLEIYRKHVASGPRPGSK